MNLTFAPDSGWPESGDAGFLAYFAEFGGEFGEKLLTLYEVQEDGAIVAEVRTAVLGTGSTFVCVDGEWDNVAGILEGEK